MRATEWRGSHAIGDDMLVASTAYETGFGELVAPSRHRDPEWYRIVRVEIPRTSPELGVTCLSCSGALPGREGAFILKYFLVDTATDRQRRKG
jgi:hypothetical protein